MTDIAALSRLLENLVRFGTIAEVQHTPPRVQAYFYDVNSAKKQEAIAGAGDNLKDLRHTFSDRQLALRAARAELNRLQRGIATLSYNLAMGRPDLIPELTYTLQGVKPEIDAIIWYGGNVQHSLTADAGYAMSLELETKLPADSVDGLYEESKGGTYTGVVAFYKVPKTSVEKSVQVGDMTRPKQTSRVFGSEKAAEKAASKEWEKTKIKNS